MFIRKKIEQITRDNSNSGFEFHVLVITDNTYKIYDLNRYNLLLPIIYYNRFFFFFLSCRIFAYVTAL